MSSNYIVCESEQEVHGYFEGENKKDGLVILNFSTTWCGPCKRMKPKVKDLAKKNEHITVLYVDADDYSDKEHHYADKVSGIPHYDFYVNGEHKETVVGGKYDKIKSLVEELGVVEKDEEGEENKSNEEDEKDEKKE